MLQWLISTRPWLPPLAATLVSCAAVPPDRPDEFPSPSLQTRSWASLAAESPAPVDFGQRKVLDRDELIAEILERNPTVDAARQAWKAAAARSAQVTLDDPMLSYALAPASVGAGRADFGEEVEVSQPLPWPGKLRRRREIEAGMAEARFHDLDEARVGMALEAARLFGDYYLVARAREINAEHVRLLTEFKEAAAAQYAVGLLSQQDPLKAEVELAHLAHQEVVLAAETRVVAARINALLHRSPDAPLPPPPARLPARPEAQVIVQASDSGLRRLEELAMARRPEIAAAVAEARARKAALLLARLEAFPDLGVAASYNSMWQDEEHRWMVGLTVSLPLWRQRIAAAVAEAEAELRAIDRRRQALEAEVRARVHQRYQRTVEAHHIVELYTRRLLPAARDQLRAERAAVETGTGSFLSLIDAERALRDAQLGYHEALSDLERRLAQLARELGCLPHELPAAIAAAVKEESAERGELQ